MRDSIEQRKFGSHLPNRCCWADEIESFLNETIDALGSKEFTDIYGNR